MTDFNKLHQLANELEEFSSKTANKINTKPQAVKTKAEILSSINSKLTFAKTKDTHLGLTKINKKSWPTSPSLQFFYSPGVINKEKDFKLKKITLNAKTLLNSANTLAFVEQQKLTSDFNNDFNNNFSHDSSHDSSHDFNQTQKDQFLNTTNPELLNTLKDIGFIEPQKAILQNNILPEQSKITDKTEIKEQDKIKKNLVYVEGTEKALDLGPVIQSQAFNCLHKELGFSLSAFSLDLALNFSIFVGFNLIYKSIYLESLLHFSTFKFIFAFSLIFQISSFVQRYIFKQTFGEWYNNIQIGTTKQQQDSLFALSLFWKSLITLLTGVMPLSIASFLINKDLSYYLTDLQTFKKLDN